jgi:hypothetical protein
MGYNYCLIQLGVVLMAAAPSIWFTEPVLPYLYTPMSNTEVYCTADSYNVGMHDSHDWRLHHIIQGQHRIEHMIWTDAPVISTKSLRSRSDTTVTSKHFLNMSWHRYLLTVLFCTIRISDVSLTAVSAGCLNSRYVHTQWLPRTHSDTASPPALCPAGQGQSLLIKAGPIS